MGVSSKGRLEGRVAVVTASTDGIGYAIAERLCQEGARVIISSRKSKNVSKAEAALKAQGYVVKGVVCHVGDPLALQNLIQEAQRFGDGTIDILISNAGISPVLAPLSQTPEAAIDAVLNVNIKSAILLVQYAAPYLSGDASIVFNASIGAFQSPLPALSLIPMYSVSKTALLGITKAFANELGPRGIRVNAVAPGIVATKLSQALTEDPKLRKNFSQSLPLKRLGTTDEIAAVVAFLASSEASYITGETLVVAGGAQSRL